MQNGEGLKPRLSFVHSSEDKVSSLTVCTPNSEERVVFLTLSNVEQKIRVKLGLVEVAGLARALNIGSDWKAYHTFEESKTRINYSGNGFLGFERENGDGKSKLAIKLGALPLMRLAGTTSWAPSWVS